MIPVSQHSVMLRSGTETTGSQKREVRSVGYLPDGLDLMSIKSKAQRRKFAELLVKGEISPEIFEEWNRAAGSVELPERLHPKAVATPKRKAKSTRASKVKPSKSRKSKS